MAVKLFKKTVLNLISHNYLKDSFLPLLATLGEDNHDLYITSAKLRSMFLK